MTEIDRNRNDRDPADTGESAGNRPATGSTEPEPGERGSGIEAPDRSAAASIAGSAGTGSGRVFGRAGLAAGIAGIVIALAIGFWAMQRFERIESETTRRLQLAEQRLTAFDAMLGQSRDLLRDLQARSTVLEGKLAETAGLQAQVEKLFRDRAEDSLDVTLAEAESALALAAQQLALGADVEAVLAAIQNIESRLARDADPRLAPVRTMLARDIERLRVHPSSDIGRLVLRIDALIGALDQLPLLATIREPAETPNGVLEAGDRPVEPDTAPSPARAGASAADRIGATVSALGRELRELFRVTRIDAPDAVLLAPQQAYFLRQNLRLMLLNARFALLSRNEAAYRSDLERARRWIDNYYDAEHRNVVAVQNQLRQMLDARLALEPPRIDDSLAAVRQARTAVR